MNRIKEYIKKTLNKYNFIISHKNSWYARQENYIAEINEDEKKIFRIVDNYSMCTEANRWVIVQAVNHIIKNNLEGDFVESGVFKGGNLILFNYLINKFKLNKKIYAYDTFEGMPESGMHDLDLKNIPAKETQKKYDNAKIKWCYENLEEVKQNIKKYDKEFEKKFIFIKGNVLKTLKIKENVPEKISLLRLDTDFYESTKIELEILFPRLVKNGILIIDDYGHWKGSKKAVDEYFNLKENFKWFHRIDYASRLLIKD